MRINKIITVLFSRQNVHSVQFKIDDPYHHDALPRFPWILFTYVGINDQRTRISLQHRRCFLCLL